MKVGFGKAVINPPVGFSLVGYFNDRRSIGIRDNLYAKSILFDDGENLCGFVSCDLIWIGKETVNKVKEIIKKELKIDSKNFFIHATHTHTGPLPNLPGKSIFQRNFYVEKSYVELLPYYIAGSLIEAFYNREEVKIGIGKSNVKGISFNRRYYLKDGRVVTNPFNQIENIVKPAGPVDNEIIVLKIEDKSGNNKGIITNFSLHPDTLGDNLISSDWPGFLREKVEKEFGGEFILLNGPSGDINHINPFDYKKREKDIPEKISRVLFEKIKEILKRIKCEEIKSLSSRKKEISLHYRDIKIQDLKKAKEYLRRKDIPEDSLLKIIYGQFLNIYEEKKKNKNLKIEVGFILLDRKILFIFIPGEIFTEIGIKIKKLSPFNWTIIAQNSNDYIGYVPTEKAFLEDENNFKIKSEYDNVRINEAIGINTSYETSPLGTKLNKNSEKILIENIPKVFKLL